MRVDKFLSVAHVIKRRTVAKELGDNGRLSINGRVAKASSEVKPLDEVMISFGNRRIVIRVLEVRDHASKQDALSMYEVVSDERVCA